MSNPELRNGFLGKIGYLLYDVSLLQLSLMDIAKSDSRLKYAVLSYIALNDVLIPSIKYLFRKKTKRTKRTSKPIKQVEESRQERKLNEIEKAMQQIIKENAQMKSVIKELKQANQELKENMKKNTIENNKKILNTFNTLVNNNIKNKTIFDGNTSTVNVNNINQIKNGTDNKLLAVENKKNNEVEMDIELEKSPGIKSNTIKSSTTSIPTTVPVSTSTPKTTQTKSSQIPSLSSSSSHLFSKTYSLSKPSSPITPATPNSSSVLTPTHMSTLTPTQAQKQRRKTYTPDTKKSFNSITSSIINSNGKNDNDSKNKGQLKHRTIERRNSSYTRKSYTQALDNVLHQIKTEKSKKSNIKRTPGSSITKNKKPYTPKSDILGQSAQKRFEDFMDHNCRKEYEDRFQKMDAEYWFASSPTNQRKQN